MTKQELLQKLEDFGDDLEVVMWIDGFWSSIHEVKVDQNGSLALVAEFGED